MNNGLPTNQLLYGDCLVRMKDLPDNSISGILTDPPYGLSFMGKNWDHGVPGIPFWSEMLRICKPGAPLMAFGGTRTFHRLACSIEDAGWLVRDCLMWLYGSGFPKSLDISKAMDKHHGRTPMVVGSKAGRPGYSVKPDILENGHKDLYKSGFRDSEKECQITAPATPEAALWEGYGTALKPSWEPILVAMKPADGSFVENALQWGVAGLNIGGGRIQHNGESLGGGYASTGLMGKLTGNVTISHKNNHNQFVDNVKRANRLGRFPANLLFTHSPDCEDGCCIEGCPVKMLDDQSGNIKSSAGPANYNHTGKQGAVPITRNVVTGAHYGDDGGASRFFYTTKASRKERSPMNNHPTVKPVQLMTYLVKLMASPIPGIILDPFCGSGTTLLACLDQGVPFIGIESAIEYHQMAVQRLSYRLQARFKMGKG